METAVHCASVVGKQAREVLHHLSECRPSSFTGAHPLSLAIYAEVARKGRHRLILLGNLRLFSSLPIENFKTTQQWRVLSFVDRKLNDGRKPSSREDKNYELMLQLQEGIRTIENRIGKDK
ncbi:hypothetical protein EJB05_00231, partial [Eragrostis curvula]